MINWKRVWSPARRGLYLASTGGQLSPPQRFAATSWQRRATGGALSKNGKWQLGSPPRTRKLINEPMPMTAAAAAALNCSQPTTLPYKESAAVLRAGTEIK